MAMEFQSIGINTQLQDILRRNGITEPTPIQEKTIPELLEGKDVLAQAQTGTGKTLAYLLPIMEKLDSTQASIQAMVITPTRELAVQVAAEAQKLSRYKKVNVLAVYGGQDILQQMRKLRAGVHIVVGTPGRLLDHLGRKTMDLSRLSLLVLDEADQMLDMGFIKDIEKILEQTPKERQTMLFSATMPDQIRTLAGKYMHKPVFIKVQSAGITLDEIKQMVVETSDRHKQSTLFKLIDQYNPYLSIIFCRTKHRASMLNTVLRRHGYKSDELHGDITQARREKVMKAFRQAKIQLLVATDVAARGLDITGVTHIFNYDVPHEPDSYIHRIGRTGRAGESGIAITLATPKDREDLRMIEKKINMTIEKKKIDKEEMLLYEAKMPHTVEPAAKPYDRVGGRTQSSRSKGYADKQDGRSKGFAGKQGSRSKGYAEKQDGRSKVFAGKPSSRDNSFVGKQGSRGKRYADKQDGIGKSFAEKQDGRSRSLAAKQGDTRGSVGSDSIQRSSPSKKPYRKKVH